MFRGCFLHVIRAFEQPVTKHVTYLLQNIVIFCVESRGSDFSLYCLALRGE